MRASSVRAAAAAVLLPALWLLGGIAGAAALDPEYFVDSTWRPQLPAGSGSYSAVAVARGLIFLSQRNASYPHPLLVYDRFGRLLRSFGGGNDEVAVVNGSFGSHGVVAQDEDTIWVMDFFKCAALSFRSDGTFLGESGGGTGPLSGCRPGVPAYNRFGKIADATFVGRAAFFADGDGGEANRVSAWETKAGKLQNVVWVSPGAPPRKGTELFHNPHGLTWHEASNRILVADRDGARIGMLDASTGEDLGSLDCPGLRLGEAGKPFGVRALRNAFADLLFVAVSNNPQDGGNQFVHVVDMSALAEKGACTAVLQSIPLAPPAESNGEDFCRTPHLMDVDRRTGEVYLACIAEPGSNVLRLAPRSLLV